jgi:hypothetical protein
MLIYLQLPKQSSQRTNSWPRAVPRATHSRQNKQTYSATFVIGSFLLHYGHAATLQKSFNISGNTTDLLWNYGSSQAVVWLVCWGISLWALSISSCSCRLMATGRSHFSTLTTSPRLSISTLLLHHYRFYCNINEVLGTGTIGPSSMSYILSSTVVKGTVSRDFRPWIFHQTIPPGPWFKG